ncbi:MAG: polysaccharide biosynthesis protein [Clostridia bacterium]|nr:polysaccharide biosynthesis protein [Clostridia bacterium]
MQKTINKKQNGFLKGVFVLSVGGIVAKLIGAFYRIPLTNLVGSYGMGLYQFVFPLFSLLLTISTAGIPVAVSKLVAEKIAIGRRDHSDKVFKTALGLLALFGLVGSVVLFAFADGISALQGNVDASGAYKIISPAVFFVCIISAYRGYFQGLMQMEPTALSQVVEQVVKMAIGLSGAIAFMPDVVKSINFAILGVTASELVALLLLVVIKKFANKKQPVLTKTKDAFNTKSTIKQLLVLCLPITMSGLIIPLTQLVDSVLVLNLLKVPNATGLYGVWAGPVHSLLNMPVVLTLGISTAIVPAISKHYAKGDDVGAKQKANFAIKLTMVVGLPCSLGLIVLAQPVTQLLYGGLPFDEILLASDMVRVAGVSVLFLSLVQTGTAILQAGGRLYAPVVFLFASTVVKTLLSVVLLSNKDINVFGAPVSSVICYFVACLGDLLYIVRVQKIKPRFNEVVAKPLACGLVMTVFLLATRSLFAKFLPNSVCVLVLVCLGVVVYLAMIVLLGVFDKKEASKVPVVGRFLQKLYQEK